MKRVHSISIGVGIGGIIVAVSCILIYKQPQEVQLTSQAQARSAPSLINQRALGELEQKRLGAIDLSHLAPGVVPPTNAWFSGFALQAEAKPGFSYPNSYRPLPNGFEMGLPTVQATSDTITGPHQADVVVTIDTAARYEIARYDELTVDIAYYNKDNHKLATLTIGSGLPYAFLQAHRDTRVMTNLTNLKHDKAVALSDVAGKTYGLSSVGTALQAGMITLKKNGLLTVFSAPDQSSAGLVAQHADSRVTGGDVSYSLRNGQYQTELMYHTANAQPTMVARMPHQSAVGSSQSVRYRSIFGDLPLEVTNRLTYTIAATPVKESLDLTKVSSDNKTLLLQQLRRDIEATELTKKDTYFGGKQLQRAAQLIDIAAQLGAQQEQDELQMRLKSALTQWFSAHKSRAQSFYYDTSMKGIVGNEASFGADKEFNDHHFHYGYFIYAASILAKYDAEFKDQQKDVVNLLVADIANYRSDETLPLRRNFDAYAGHGWASGIAPFSDGNNQESSSEAINAWTAVALWGKQTDNRALEVEGQWMLSNEVITAKTYWLQPNSQNVPYLRSYTSPIVAINWGGKREYRTFFSDEPNAKIGIQILPLNPTMKVLLPAFTSSTLRSSSQGGIFGDYITMAQSQQTLKQAQALPDSVIDDGNSRTYLYAWVLTK